MYKISYELYSTGNIASIFNNYKWSMSFKNWIIVLYTWNLHAVGKSAKLQLKKNKPGISGAVQWWGLCASTSGSMGSSPGWGTKILHNMRTKKKSDTCLIPIFSRYLENIEWWEEVWINLWRWWICSFSYLDFTDVHIRVCVYICIYAYI